MLSPSDAARPCVKGRQTRSATRRRASWFLFTAVDCGAVESMVAIRAKLEAVSAIR